MYRIRTTYINIFPEIELTRKTVKDMVNIVYPPVSFFSLFFLLFGETYRKRSRTIEGTLCLFYVREKQVMQHVDILL